MNRKDSGFVESHTSKAIHQTPTPVQRSNTASTHRRKSKKAPTDMGASSKLVEMEAKRPVSESQSRPRPSHQQSTASSENSTKSRNRGHGSKPSSRRTSCTIVDPSRPARHYRMKSSHSVPTANSQDIDDVLALHFRSCSLFTNPSYHSNSGLPSPTLSQGEKFIYPSAASRFSSDNMHVVQEVILTEQSEEPIAIAEKTNTTMHWTSPCSRKREYERIDKANSGIRGMFRKAVPRCVSGPQEKFYEKDQSDAGSVRRYRLDDVDHHAYEKDISPYQARSFGRSSRSRPKTSWGCF